MYYVCLDSLKFPKKKTDVYSLAERKYEWARSAFGKRRRRRWRRKKKEVYFSYMRKILKQVHADFSGCSWVLDALGSLDDWRLEWVSLEAVRLSFYNHRRAVTSREILEAVKQRLSWKSF
ncbi:histone H2A.N [Dasypus novemcinctus]|uniref:histone H2A.N n=1 Tax=Dasypus novemcinctus TaxID=9361 RepID=UPI0003CC1ED3|nr:histone H2A.N [Dasypus novemcinctus]